VDAWSAIERTQRADPQDCWLVTQPSHAALSGELAAQLREPVLGRPEDAVVRAIALHDAGWGMPDAEMVRSVRAPAGKGVPIKSFVDATPAQFLRAWNGSIETAAKVPAAGGYIVSRHFCRLAEGRAKGAVDSPAEARQLREFLSREQRRQQRLRDKDGRPTEELELVVDLLQFCDVLSLYVCCGATEEVELPHWRGRVKIRTGQQGQRIELEPSPLPGEQQFSFAAIRRRRSRDDPGNATFRIVLR